jgi:hypothetical protein
MSLFNHDLSYVKELFKNTELSIRFIRYTKLSIYL